MSFLENILPTEGKYCVAILLKHGGFQHFFHDTLEDVEAQITYQNNKGFNVYVAQASFDGAKIDEAKAHNAGLRGLSKEDYNKQKKKTRAQENALYLRNFFLDIDCGPDKDYPTQKEAAAELKRFIAETALPWPSVVSSGNGLYAQWCLKENVPANSWQTIAKVLKKVTVAYEFKTDPMRTADSASVLRPAGTLNRKPGKETKPVSLLKDAGQIGFSEFAQLLHVAAKKKKVDITALEEPKASKDINAEFYEGLEQKATNSAELIAGKCAQLAQLRDTRGNLAEPIWYAGLGILVFCIEEDLIQEWSNGHPDYTASKTRDKAEQYRCSGVGPTTCAQFGMINPGVCIGCPHNGKIKSPIVLGRPEPVQIQEFVDEMPTGFKLTDEGLFFDDEGRWFKFYDQRLKIARLADDKSLGYQTATVQHSLPYEGDMEFAIRSSLVHDAKGLLTTLSDNHVHVVGAREKKIMVAYFESYIGRLARIQKMATLCNQMGWTEDLQFVLGPKIFYKDGTIQNASLGHNVPKAAKGYRPKGDLSKWVAATRRLDAPEMEPFAFALLSGFAAPLFRFTGFEGAMVSMVGKTGVGKTLMLHWIQSIYGSYDDLKMLKDDTRNALISRLGVYGNLPLTVDEVTNIEASDLSDLVYRVTQGRDKVRLTKNAEERKNVNNWNTLAVVSTNSALSDKLVALKHDAGAELNRVFEYEVPFNPRFSGEVTTDIFWTLTENFGLAGEKYVRWLAQNTDRLSADIKRVKDSIEPKAELNADERFWGAVAATVVYGGLVAKKLGLIEFDVARVSTWAIEQIKGMHEEKVDTIEDTVSIMGQFIDAHSSNRIVVRKLESRGDYVVVEKPYGGLVMRLELDTGRLFISRNALRQWLAKHQGAYSTIKMELSATNALIRSSARKALGAGTQYNGAVQPCWELDTKHPQLGGVGLRLIQSVNEKLEGKTNEEAE